MGETKETFREVCEHDAEYVRWTLGQVNPVGKIARFEDYLRSKPSRFDIPKAPEEGSMTTEVQAVHQQLYMAKESSLNIRKALHRTLMLRYHPDKNHDNAAKHIFCYLGSSKDWFDA